jgi:two-component system nitrogen regulation sensor histidine kinase NtrY
VKARELVERYRKDPRVIITVPVLIVAATSLIYYAVQKTKELSPEALSSQVLLFVLWNINLLLIVGIVFVLLRGVVKLVLERQRGILGSRFRTKLVAAWLATSLVPVIVLFIIATDLLRVSIDRWFNTPVRTILSNGETIAQMAQDQAGIIATDAAREIASMPGAVDAAQVDSILGRTQRFHSVDLVGVYRDGQIVKVAANPRAPIQEVGEPPRRFFDEVASRGSALKLDVAPSGKWVRSGVRIEKTPYVAIAGVFIPAEMSRLIDESIIANENYRQLDAQRPALKASQTSLFLAATLAILFGTMWTSIYASRRITIPITALAEATGKLAGGGYGSRVDVTATDEVGRLIESFNRMSQQLDEQRQALTSANRYFATVLDSVSAGIIAFSDNFEVLGINRSAREILQIEQPETRAKLDAVLTGELSILHDALRELTSRSGASNREVTLIRRGELRYLELAVARLSGGTIEGWVVAMEDSTELVRAQKLAAWNEAARRIAHEIKNPLTPIQLSAERIAKKFSNQDPDAAEAIDEGTRTIVSEVNQLKRMVDEFSRFARMPAVHLRHAGLAEILQQAASLYRDVKPGVSVSVTVEPDIELLVDPEQIRRAVGNLLKNAVEATESGEVRVSARRAPHRVVIEVADPGRGVPDSDKEKLFLPYFSTKGRGTGLGLAIVHRIVNDHDGRISVHDNHPKGTRFEIELPA